jgi:hypothetical protein
MSRCLGTKRDNSPCTVAVEPPQTYCWWHDPANAEIRKQAASKGGKRGGRGRPSVELQEAKQLVRGLAAGVLQGTIDRSDAAVCGQLYNVYLRAVSVELKAREQMELTERLEALEEALEQRKEQRRYGA